ncbi:MAG: hypothetical protein ACE14T_05320 [Syntrophales bacterium]
MTEKGMKWDTFFKLPKETFELMSNGFDMYNRITKSWMDYIDLTSRGRPEDLMKNWMESYRNIYKDMFDMFSKPFKITEGSEKTPWQGAFETWQQLLSKAPAGRLTPENGIEEFIKFSRQWQESYMKVFNAWLDFLEKAAASYKADKEKGAAPEDIWKSCLKSSEDFLQQWTQFVSEQTKAFFRLQSAVAEEKEVQPEKKGASRKKEEK